MTKLTTEDSRVLAEIRAEIARTTNHKELTLLIEEYNETIEAIIEDDTSAKADLSGLRISKDGIICGRR